MNSVLTYKEAPNEGPKPCETAKNIIKAMRAALAAKREYDMSYFKAHVGACHICSNILSHLYNEALEASQNASGETVDAEQSTNIP